MITTESPLGAPLDVGSVALRNRFVATAHASGQTRDGLPVEGDAEYWKRVADGGAAMLISGGTAPAIESTPRRRNLVECWRPEVVEGWSRRADAIHAGGGIAISQFVHLGRETLGSDALCAVLDRVAGLVDYVNVTVGVRNTYVRDMGTEHPPLLDHIARLRAQVAVPVVGSQAFRAQADREAALAAGADLIGMAHPFIADPELPNKILSGRAAQVRPCVSCNEDCRVFDPCVLCSVNPDLAPPGSERRPAMPLRLGAAAPASGRVAVVGAGPAGLECALRLARSGTPVTVFEERVQIGGQLAIATAAPHRRGWQRLLAFYAAELERHGAEVLLGRRADADVLASFDDVVVAVGADEGRPAAPRRASTPTPSWWWASAARARGRGSGIVPASRSWATASSPVACSTPCPKAAPQPRRSSPRGAPWRSSPDIKFDQPQVPRGERQ